MVILNVTSCLYQKKSAISASLGEIPWPFDTLFSKSQDLLLNIIPAEIADELKNSGIEKIKTIGDAYLAVCGLPHEVPDHAQRITKAALEIQEYVRNNSGKFEMRIGINSGPVVAGIVGVKKFAYDIWGDTVNTASRMESESEAGKVNISETTYDLIKDLPGFSFESRGKVVVKGKGEMAMWFVHRSF